MAGAGGGGIIGVRGWGALSELVFFRSTLLTGYVIKLADGGFRYLLALLLL